MDRSAGAPDANAEVSFSAKTELASTNGHWPDLDLRPARDPDPLIPEGEYEGFARRAEIRPAFSGRPRLFLLFELYGGAHDGTVLFFIAPLPHRKRDGHFARGIAPSSKFYRAWVIASGGKRPRRRDRMSLEPFRDKLFKIRVRTVVDDYKQRPLPEAHRYSVVDEILERLA